MDRTSHALHPRHTPLGFGWGGDRPDLDSKSGLTAFIQVPTRLLPCLSHRARQVGGGFSFAIKLTLVLSFVCYVRLQGEL